MRNANQANIKDTEDAQNESQGSFCNEPDREEHE